MSKLPNVFRLSPVLVLSAGLYASAAGASQLPVEASMQTADQEITSISRPGKAAALSFDVADQNESMRFAGLGKEKGEKNSKVDWDKHGKDKDKDNHPGEDEDGDEDQDSDVDFEDGTSGSDTTGSSTGTPAPTTAPSAVPIPAALWLLVSGIFGLGVAGARRQRC